MNFAETPVCGRSGKVKRECHGWDECRHVVIQRLSTLPKPSRRAPVGAIQIRGCYNIMTFGGKKMKGEAPTMSSKEMAQIRQNLEGTPDIEEAAELMNL